MIKYGDNLRYLREAIGLSQKELTDRLKINRSTYARYETSATQPDFETLGKLADFYGVSVDYILGRIDSSNLDISPKVIKINTAKTNTFTQSTGRVNRDIAKRLKEFERELQECDGLAFNGEPMSDEAKESLLESMELLFRQTQRINKKFAPKKYRDEE